MDLLCWFLPRDQVVVSTNSPSTLYHRIVSQTSLHSFTLTVFLLIFYRFHKTRKMLFGHLVLLAPAVLASVISPLKKRDACESPQTQCGNTCIAPIDICCPAAPNGEIIGCSGVQNCWVNPDGSPGCCPLFSDCAGYKAGDGAYPTHPSITTATSAPTGPPLQPPPTVGTPSVPIPTSKTVPPVSTVTPPSPKTSAASSHVSIPLSTGSHSTRTGNVTIPHHTNTTPADPSLPAYTGAGSTILTSGTSLFFSLFLGVMFWI